jgi:hypothetical protein
VNIPADRVVRWLRWCGGGVAAIGAYMIADVLVRTGRLDARWVGFTSFMIALLAFESDVRRWVHVGLRVLFEGTAAPTIAQEVEMLEHLLSHDPPPEKAPLWAVRLAELYRVHLREPARADALLDRFLLEYPTSRELLVARRGA